MHGKITLDFISIIFPFKPFDFGDSKPPSSYMSPLYHQLHVVDLEVLYLNQLFLILCIPFPDRTPQRLEFTLKVAEETFNRSVEVLQTVVPISSKVEEWANNMKNNEYSTAAYEQAVSSAGEAGIRPRATHTHICVLEVSKNLSVQLEQQFMNIS